MQVKLELQWLRFWLERPMMSLSLTSTEKDLRGYRIAWISGPYVAQVLTLQFYNKLVLMMQTCF